MYRRILLVLLACGEIAVVLWLLRHGKGPWQEAAGTGLWLWLQTTNLEDAVVALIGATAIVGSAWLIISTLFAVIAHVTRIPAMVRSIHSLAPSPVRRLAERMAVSVLMTSALASTPIGAEDSSVFVAADGSLLPPALSGSVPVPDDRPAGPNNSLITVLPGDSLWSISAQHLTGSMGRRPDTGEIAAFWRLVVEHNRSRLSSGNPDLIYPGEIIELPPTG